MDKVHAYDKTKLFSVEKNHYLYHTIQYCMKEMRNDAKYMSQKVIFCANRLIKIRILICWTYWDPDILWFQYIMIFICFMFVSIVKYIRILIYSKFISHLHPPMNLEFRIKKGLLTQPFTLDLQVNIMVYFTTKS